MEARRRDQVAAAEIKAQEDCAWNARQVAGIGYDLAEETSVTGPSAGLVYVESVVDCALKCASITCEAFAFSSNGTRMHGCYRYQAPVTLVRNAAYTAGKRIAAATARQEADGQGGPAGPASPPGEAFAQAGIPAPRDDLTRCASGPVKVTGFKLFCDSLIAGGSSPGSSRERYVVPDINACAAWCRKAAHCSGFAFDAAQRGDKHDCQILGRGFITNPGSGWVSGTRP